MSTFYKKHRGIDCGLHFQTSKGKRITNTCYLQLSAPINAPFANQIRKPRPRNSSKSDWSILHLEWNLKYVIR